MKVQKNATIKSYITEYKFEKEDIRIKIKIKVGGNLEYRKNRYKVIFKGRKTNKEIRKELLGIDLSKGEFCILVSIKPGEYLKEFGNDIVDVYLEDKKENTITRVSSEKLEGNSKIYYNSKEKTFIQIFRNNDNGLSLRKKTGGREIYLKDISITNEGLLSVEGILNCSKLDASGKNNNLKKAVILDKDKNICLESQVELFEVEELVKENLYSGVNYEKAGFKFVLNMIDLKMKDIVTNGMIYLVFGDEEIMVKLRQPKKKVSLKQIITENKKPNKLVEFKGRRYIKLTVEDIRKDIEIKDYNTSNNDLELVLKKELADTNLSKENMKLVFKNENREKEYEIKTRIIENKDISIIASLSKFAENKSLEFGEYSVSLRVNKEDRKVVSRYGCMEEGKLKELPKLYLENKKTGAVSVKAYYTKDCELKVKVEPVIEVKKLESIYSDSSGVTINAVVDIQKTLDKDVNELQGFFSIELLYGVIVKLPYVAKINNTEKSNTRYKFKMFINKNDIESSKLSVGYLIKNIGNKIAICTVENIDEIREFIFKIKAKDVKSTVEDKIKKYPIAKTAIDKISYPMYSIFNKTLPLKNNLVVFQSNQGRTYSCGPKAIFEELETSKEKYKCVWVLDEVHKELPGLPKVVKPESLKYYYYMSRAKYIVSDTEMPNHYKKRKGVLNIETEKEFVGLGSPKNDVFYKDPKKKSNETRMKLSIPENKKVILYAPSLKRVSENNTKVPFSLETFDKMFGEEYVLLVRLRRDEVNNINELNSYSKVKDVSLYDDITELYLASDMLITDYSDVIFDYANSKKPMLFYDYEMLKSETVEDVLLLELQKVAPGPKVKSEEELFEYIKNINKISNEYKKAYSQFAKMYCSKEDGKASKRVIEQVFAKESAK